MNGLTDCGPGRNEGGVGSCPCQTDAEVLIAGPLGGNATSMTVTCGPEQPGLVRAIECLVTPTRLDPIGQVRPGSPRTTGISVPELELVGLTHGDAYTRRVEGLDHLTEAV